MPTTIATSPAPIDPILVQPIGVVRNDFKERPAPRPDSSGEQGEQELKSLYKSFKNQVSELALAPEHAPLLDGIEGFSHVLVLFWPHKLAPESRSLQKVHPRRRKDIPKQGIFATRSPARPNPILLTTVRLLSREGATLRVQGLDAMDGSPVLDIKPYSPGLCRVESPTVPEWMEKLQQEMDSEGA